MILLKGCVWEDSRVPWTSRRSNQSILKEIRAEYSLEGLMLKLQILAICCVQPICSKRPWCLESFKTWEEGENRGWNGWILSLTQWTWVWASCRRWRQGCLVCCSPWGHKELDTTYSLNNNKIASFINGWSLYFIVYFPLPMRFFLLQCLYF